MNDIRIDVKKDEVPILESILCGQKRGNGEPWTLHGLISAWMGFVCHVSRGYELTIDDYCNDLACRDALQEVIDGCPQRLQTEIERIVKPFDQRFYEATREIGKPLIGWRLFGGDKQWRRRIPLMLKEELERDLSSLGYIE